MVRPDFSNYLAHFTQDGEPKRKDKKNPAMDYKELSAFDKLVNILRSKTIYASMMPWTGARAVCFTECPWSSLIDHTEKYSPYGIGFHKAFVYSRNGAPAIYVRQKHFEEQKALGWAKHVYNFITPFRPEYRSKKEKTNVTCDYTHEREWRVPHDMEFEYSNIEFVILKNYESMAQFPDDLRDIIGGEKFILMDNYKKVEELWPVHIQDR